VTRPRAVLTSPLRVEDSAYIEIPQHIDDRSHPAITPETQAYWSGIANEKLVLDKCLSCSRWSHVPVGACQWCGGPVEAVEADPRVTVNTFSVCYLEFGPGLTAPYIAAHVNPVVEPDLQITTNIVGCRIDEVRCDGLLKPVFVHGANLSLLFYTPIR
jgi:uncharacterized OB-fold protein